MGLDKLQEGVQQKLEENRERGRKMKDHRTEYKKLDDRLSTLPDKLTHDVMVPFTTKAFMPGQLVHSNEIMVLLGENYFLETSAKHAREICSRRIQQCDKMLTDLEAEMKLVEGWRSQTKELREEGEQCQDITEEYTEEQLKEWREKHRESVKREKMLEKENKLKIETDEDLWQRLEELEVREALEKEWEQEGGDGDEDDDEDDDEEYSEDDEDDGDLTDDYSQDDGYDDRIEDDEDVGAAAALNRRVSFGPDQVSTATQEIRFKHSLNGSEPLDATSVYPNHPGEITLTTSPTTSPTPPPSSTEPKSILKSVPYNPADFVRQEQPETAETCEPSKPFVNPVHLTVKESVPSAVKEMLSVSATVKERVPEPADAAEESVPVKRVSKFKSMRSQK